MWPFCLGGGEGRTGPGDTGEELSCVWGEEVEGDGLPPTPGESEGETFPRTLSAQLLPFLFVSGL